MDTAQIAPAQVVLLLRQHHDRPALRSLVRQRRELRGVGQPLCSYIRRRNKFRSLAIAQRDGSGLVEQQRVHVARGLDRAPAHGQHVVLHQPIHAGNADRRKQPADRRRNQANQQRHQHKHRLRRLGVDRKRLQRNYRQQEDNRQSGEQNDKRDLIRRLLPRRAFHQRDHAIQKRLAGVRRDADLHPVRQHLRSAGDSRPVAAGFANHGSRLARDGGLVNGGNALDHFTIACDVVPGWNIDDVAGAKQTAGDLLQRARKPCSAARSSRLWPCAACRPAPCRALRPSLRRSWQTAP